MIDYYLIALIIGLTGFGVASLLLPELERLAARRGWFDRPDGIRKLHVRAIPRLGGVALAIGTFAGVLVTTMVAGLTGLPLVTGLTGPTGALLVGMMLAAATGLYDDINHLPARKKLAAQVLATLPLMMNEALVGPVRDWIGGPGWVAALLVLGWVLFVMNAVNLLDGMDGLAGGVALLMLFFLALLGGLQASGLFLCMALGGSLLAFLRRNLPPARIFMGDSGSLFIGYALGGLTLAGFSADPSLGRLTALVLVLGVPVFDTLLALGRRLLRGTDPLAPDHDHLHHRLLTRFDRDVIRTLYGFYGMTAGLGGLAIIGGLWAPVAAVALASVLIGYLGYGTGARRTRRRIPARRIVPHRPASPVPQPRAPLPQGVPQV